MDPFEGRRKSLQAASPRATAWTQARVAELPPPATIRDRNLAQLDLARRFAERFGVDLVHAVEAIAPLYAAKHPPMGHRAVALRRRLPA